MVGGEFRVRGGVRARGGVRGRVGMEVGMRLVLFMIRGGRQVPNIINFKMRNPPISFYFH